MIKIHTRKQTAGLTLVVGAIASAPIIYKTYTEWQLLCRHLYVQIGTLKCVFLSPHSVYFTPFVLIMASLLVIGLGLIFWPLAKKHL